MLTKLGAQLDEVAGPHRIAGAIFGMVAPDPQRHAIARIGQEKLAIGFLLTRHFCA
jgi:hypothetical protein